MLNKARDGDDVLKASGGPAAPRILLYSHDTFGLGNVRRTMLIAHEMLDAFPAASVLIVTGSPVIHAFRIPERVDYVKLPCLDRTKAEHYEPRYLRGSEAEVGRTRRAILRESVLGFAPDLMIVDKRPAGVDGELIGALEALRASGANTRLVLGMRDILDAPERTAASLRRRGCFDVIERFYDEVWIYGVRDIFDAVREYSFPASIAERTRYCGYLRRPSLPQAARVEGAPRVLVTTGSGADGFPIVESYLEGLGRIPRATALASTVVLGPHLASHERNSLLQRFGHMQDVSFIDFESDMTARYAESDVVLAMAGYNTVCELLSCGSRAVLVPRAEPVREQLIRAERFAPFERFAVVEPDRLEPDLLIDTVLMTARRTPAIDPPVDLGGLPRIRERVGDLLGVPVR